MFDEKKLEVKHHAWSDPAVVGQVQRDRQLAERLQAAEDANYARNLQRFNQGNPIRHAIAPAPAVLQPIINMPPMPNQNADIANLQNRMNKVEDEDKKLQERIRNALILENPRLLEAVYPAVRPMYNPARIIDAALLNEMAKKEQLDQTYRKLKEIYGEEAPVKYLERSLRRIEEEAPKPKTKPRPKSPKNRPKSPKPRPKSPPKPKTKPRTKSPPKKKK